MNRNKSLSTSISLAIFLLKTKIVGLDMKSFSKIIFYIKRPRYFFEVLYLYLEKLLVVNKFISYKKNKLVIFDDIFPHPISAFRFSEFKYYLDNIDDIHVFTTGTALKSIHEENKSIQNIIEDYLSIYPSHRDKLGIYTPHKHIIADLAYIVFAGNVIPFLNLLEKETIPFVFTLYPGKGLRLGDEDCDADLTRIFSSPMFKKVIVTQKIVQDYLLENNFCPIEKIKFIYGVVLPFNNYIQSVVPKKFYPVDKNTFDICFVANKQMLKGIDKGYDIFINVAHVLARHYDNINFHVVGPYSENDIDVTALTNRIKFYGKMLTDEFPAFYSGMDIILSPNRSNVLSKGSFDGFPTGACTEAGLNGVALFVTDDLNQNIKFNDGQDIVIIQPTEESIVEKVSYFYRNFEELYALAQNGQKKITTIYNEDAQLSPRLNLLLSTIEENKLTSAI